MTDIAIRVESLSKMSHIGRAQQRHDTLCDVPAPVACRLPGKAEGWAPAFTPS